MAAKTPQYHRVAINAAVPFVSLLAPCGRAPAQAAGVAVAQAGQRLRSSSSAGRLSLTCTT